MKKYKIAVAAMLALFALGAAGCLFSFAWLSLQELSRQSRLSRQAAFELQQKEFQALGEEHDAWKRLPDELQRFRREHIINMDGFAAFRRDLNSCLVANRLTATNISSQFGRSNGKTRKVTINFALEGAYRDLKKFIYDMEKKPKMQFFERIEMNGSGAAVKGRFTMEAVIGE